MIARRIVVLPAELSSSPELSTQEYPLWHLERNTLPPLAVKNAVVAEDDGQSTAPGSCLRLAQIQDLLWGRAQEWLP